MSYGLLANADPTREVLVGEASLLALIGFAIVFLGIAFLIFIVWLVGKVIVRFNDVKTKKANKDSLPPAEIKIDEDIENALSEETIAVITAAVMAYYQQTQQKCEFIVKRIKRI